MSPVAGRWQVRLTSAADADIAGILRWTLNEFGTEQMRRYSRLLESSVVALVGGPDITGARTREDIGPGLRTLHVAPGSRKGRHFILFRVAAKDSDRAIEVLRVLHDAMDLPRYRPSEDRL